MGAPADPLPQDLAAAREMIRRLNAALAEKDEALTQRDVALARLTTMLTKLRRRQFGRKSERLDPEQMALGLEDIETAIGAAEAEEESRDATLKASRGKTPASNAASCRTILRASRPLSISRTKPVPAAAAACMSSAKTPPSVLM